MTIAQRDGSCLLRSHPSGCGGRKPLNGGSEMAWGVGGGGTGRSERFAATRAGGIIREDVIVMMKGRREAC